MSGGRQQGLKAVASVNGERMPLEEARIPARDRGFLFGDAVYEVIRVYAGRLWLEDEHFIRLSRSLDAVGIAGIDMGRLRTRMREAVASGPFGDATAYVQITRGSAPRSHRFPTSVPPLEFFCIEDFVDSYEVIREDGATVLAHPDLRWGRCDIKSTNLLANVLAMQAAVEAGCQEALLYLPDGTVTEGTHTSCFAVRDGRVLATPLGPDILPGITRSLVLFLAEGAQIPVSERPLKRAELPAVDELFLTGTTSEVMPAVRVDGRPVGSGQPGPVTRKLQRAYREAVADFLATSPVA